MPSTRWLPLAGFLGPLLLLAASGSPPTRPEGPPSANAGPERLPAGVDLRLNFQRWGLENRRQGSRGTCSAFTVVAALEFAIAKKQLHSPRLSVEFLNWAANQTAGDTADGGFFSDLWSGFAAHGVCAEAAMPYAAQFDRSTQPTVDARADAKARLSLGLQLHWIKGWNVHTGLTDDHWIGIKRTLSEGWPVCGGFRWPKQPKWADGVLQMCATNAVYDGHSVLLVGYRDDARQPGGGVFMFRNSAGDGRDGSMPYGYARAFMNDAAWIGYPSAPPGRAPSARP